MALPKIEQPIYFMPRMAQLPTMQKLPRMDRMESMPQLPRLPSLPQQTRQHEYVLPHVSTLQADVDKRMEYAFDYDNPNQVNSYADVIMRTFTSIYDNMVNQKPIHETVSGLISDSWELLNRGTIQPVANRDWAMLFRNSWLNFQETVDLVDNIWKGFAIGGDLSLTRGTFNWEGAKAGVRSSIVDRVNYDWDTGNKAKDLFLEMATPTNLALLISGLGAGAVGKTALKESGETAVKKGVAARFARASRGTFDDTLRAMGRNFTQAEIDALKNVSRHIPDLQILNSMNTIRRGIDFVDSIGPKVAWGMTVKLPWKTLGVISKVPSNIMRTYARVVDEVMSKYPDTGLVSTLAAKPDIEMAIKNLNDAQTAIKNPEVLIASEHLISAASNTDNTKLKNIFNDFYKTYDSKKLIEQYMEDLYGTTGEFKAYELARAEYRSKSFDDLLAKLDSFANEVSSGTYKTFDEYVNLVETLHKATDSSPGLNSLYTTVKNLEIHMHARFIDDTNKVINRVLKGATDVIERQLEISNAHSKAIGSQIHVLEMQQKAFNPKALQSEINLQAETLLNRVGDINTPEMQLRLSRIHKELSAEFSKTASVKIGDLSLDDVQLYLVDLNRQLRTLKMEARYSPRVSALQNKIDSIREPFNKIIETNKTINQFNTNELKLESLRKTIQEDFGIVNLDTEPIIKYLERVKDAFRLQTQHGGLSQIKQDVLTKIDDFIDNLFSDLTKYSTDVQKQIANNSIKDLSQLSGVYLKFFDDAIESLNNITSGLLATTGVGEGLKTLANKMYGKSIMNFAKDTLEILETQYKHIARTSFEESFNSTFIKNGVVDHKAYNTFIETIEGTLKGFDEDLFKTLGEYKNASPTFEGITFELANSADRLEDMIATMKVNNGLVFATQGKKLDTTLVENIMEELYNVRHHIDRTLRDLTHRVDGAPIGMGVFPDELTDRHVIERLETVARLEKMSTDLTDIQNTLGLSADVMVEWTKDIMKSYHLKFNATLKNLYLLQNEDLNNILDIAASENWAQMPILESLEAMSRYDTDNLRTLQQALHGSSLQEIQDAYYNIFKKAIDRDTFDIPQTLVTVETILKVQESSAVIMDTLSGMVSVKQFYDSVQTAVDKGLDPNVASTFVDAIQRTYDKPASLVSLQELAENPRLLDLEFKKVMDNMENQLRNLSIDTNVRLENWGEWLRKSDYIDPADLDEFERIFGKSGTAHTAGGDAYMTYLIDKNILETTTKHDVKNIYMDVEASGTSFETSTHYQISAVIPETGVYRTYFNTGVIDPKDMPHEDEIYYLLFGDSKNRDIPLDVLKNDFIELYQKGNTDILKKYYDLDVAEDKTIKGLTGNIRSITFKNSPQEFIFMDDEASLLREYITYVKSQKPPGGAVRFRTYNGLEYDIPLMNTKARLLGVDELNIGEYMVHDSQAALEELLGLRRLTVEERSTIENLILEHINRRNQELSVLGNKRGIDGVTKKLDENLTKFLPTMDQNFRQAYDNLVHAFDPQTKQEIVNSITKIPGDLYDPVNMLWGTLTSDSDFFSEIQEALFSVMEDLKSFGLLDQRLKQFKITVNANDFATGGRILPDNFMKGIPKELGANHVGVDMVTFNTHNGIYIPIIAPKKDVIPNLVFEYFDTQRVTVSDFAMRRMTELAGNIQRTMSYVRNPELINSFDIDTLHELHDTLLDRIRSEVGRNNFTSVAKDLKKGDTPLRSFATTYELFKIYNNLVNGVVPQVPGADGIMRYPFIEQLLQNEKFYMITQTMLNPKEAFKSILREKGLNDKFFELPHLSDDTEKVLELLTEMSKNGIKTLEELETVTDRLEFARLKRVAPTYRNMLESFEMFQEAVNKTANYIEDAINSGALKETPTLNKNTAKSAAFSTVRNMSEGFDAVIAYNKLEQVVTMEPEELAAFIRHQGKGLFVFSNENLRSSTYFPRRGLTKMTDILENRNMLGAYQDLINNKAKLEELGLGVNVTRDQTFIFIKDWSKVADLKYKPIGTDFDMDEWLELIVATSLKDAGEIGDILRDISYDEIIKSMQATYESRKHLIGLAPDGGTSTLEYLDEIAMEKIMTKYKKQLPGMVDIMTLKENGVFDGNFFNHSVLGHIDGRREVLDFISFNPSKTMYYTTDMIERHLGAQVQLLELVRTPEFMLKNLLGEGKMTKQSMLEYLQQSPHLKVAFLNDKTGVDGIQQFRLASVNIKTMKDLDFALRMNATILDPTTFNMAYGAINQYKISNPFLRFLEQTLVRPFKIGWLAWNYGTVLRNILDAGVKNLVTTKDLAIVPAMIETTRDYFRYQNTLIDIYRHASNMKITPAVAVEEYFAKTANPRMPRRIFDMISEYQKMGGEMSQAKEIMNYYGDSITKMYNRVGKEASGLSADDFREFVKLPDDVAERWLKEKFPKNVEHVRLLMDTKNDLLTYKRAYQMHKIYKGNDISVDNFVTYLKSGRHAPGQESIMKELLDQTSHIRLEDDMITKLYNHPLLANSLDWNSKTEDIMRLSLYRYLKDAGDSNFKAMAEVIRTHYDYSHKSHAQLYMEMLFPFSTFRTLSLQYWVEELGKSPQGLEAAMKTMEAMTGFKEHRPEDVMIRRSLRYQMFTGNLILNDETGFTAKLNPSVMDMMGFFLSPVDYLTENMHSGAQSAVNLFYLEPYENEKEEDFLYRKQTLAWNMVPLLGNTVNRVRHAQRNAVGEEGMLPGKFLLNLLLSPLFNTTWTPEQGGSWQDYNYQPWLPGQRYFRFKDYQRRPYSAKRQYYRRTYPKRYYDKKQYPKMNRSHTYLSQGFTDRSSYSPFARTYNRSVIKFRRGSAYPTKASRSLNYAFSSVWRRSMTKAGNPKYRFLSFPTNKWTLQLKVNILRSITSYNRWQ